MGEVIATFIVEFVAAVAEFIFDLARAFFRPSGRPKRSKLEDSKHSGTVHAEPDEIPGKAGKPD